ncbi:MAG: carboxymuconolactone decarboxylase family protein, partial [Ferruginibacter sp.]
MVYKEESLKQISTYMDRIEKSKEKHTQLFGEGTGGVRATDPGFQDIMSHFIFSEVFYQGNIDDRMRQLITLVVLSVNQTSPQLKAPIAAALNIGLTPIEIKEAVYQCAPYIGFP